MKCTPDTTRKHASSTPSIRMRIPISGIGQQKQKVVPIRKIENTCLLGNDFPFVFLGMRGAVSKTSQGRGELTAFLKMLRTTKETSGTKKAELKVLEKKYRITKSKLGLKNNKQIKRQG